MSGTIDGGKAAAKTNKANFGDDFYRNIGAIGGQNGHTGGFAANHELASKFGALGGKISRRGQKLTPEEVEKIKNEHRPKD